MRRTELAVCAIFLLVALGLAALTRPAGATLGTTYDDLVCQDPNDVGNQFVFAHNLIGVPGCTKLCFQAVAICQRNVRDAAACQLAFAADWISLDSQVDCAGLTGAELSDCKAGWAADLKTWKLSILSERTTAINLCGQNNATCLQCVGQ
ncbi:MAG TPA: hypothetical protein VEN47_09410 [Myxococcota bacterium]|nr:hypothetical protein [Myxococcota bacterium]